MGWKDAAFDDSSWAPAEELVNPPLNVNLFHLPVDPYVSPEPAGIPLRTSIPMELRAIASGKAPAGPAEDPTGRRLRRRVPGLTRSRPTRWTD